MKRSTHRFMQQMRQHASENTFVGTVIATQLGYLSLYLVYFMVAVLITIVTRGHLSYEYYQSEKKCASSMFERV